ncbi:MAG: PLP-dependent aminotransferase family protein [Ruminococcaceae bacterium]|nr:PLP-dependent aminotransferase family protein [Oscillospiraceae bacterium]
MEYQISNKLKNMKPSAIREIFKSLTDPSIIAFAAGNPAAESFPVEAIAELSNNILTQKPITALQYGITEGYPPLREAMAKRLSDKFGIGRPGDMTIVVSGGQQGLELTCKTLCNEGDTVLAEDPSFIGALNCFRSNGAVVKGVPMNDDGIDTALLEKALKEDPKVKMLYLIPTFQNPTGRTMSLKTRCEVYELAVRYGVVILEDNPYGELRFEGKELPTFKSMDTEGIVVYCSSLSKVLSSGMRIGFLTGNEVLMQKIVVAKQGEDVHTTMLPQMICADYMAKYDTDKHIEGIRALYRRKCGIMLDALDKYMPDCVKYTRPEGGLFLWCTLPAEIDLDTFVKEALKRKVAVVPGTAFNCDLSAYSDSFRMTYATPTEEQIVEGIKILGELVKEFINK